jgi:hypothetical protein
MKYRAIAFSVVLAAAWSSLAFAQAPNTSSQLADEAPPVFSVPREYKYDSHGRRDPFINPVPKAAGTKPAAPIVRPPGLKGVLMAEATIAGVVTSRVPSMNVVIINAPAGKTYFAHTGDELFDALVREIRLDSVTFAMKSSASGTDRATPREIVRKVRPTPGE